MKKCPFCAEEVQDGARKCKHCGEWIEKNEQKKTTDHINIGTIDIKKKILSVYKRMQSKAWFRRTLKYLYLDRNRITGLEFFIGGRKIVLCLLIIITPTFLISLRGQSIRYTVFGAFLTGLSNFLGYITLIPGLFLLRAGIKQTINRRHDLGYSGWFTLLSMFFIAIGGNANEIIANDYGWFGWVMILISFIFGFWFIFTPGNRGGNKYGERADKEHSKKNLTKPQPKSENEEESNISTTTILIIVGSIGVGILIMRLITK